MFVLADVFGVCCPLTPDPSPPLGARGGFVVSFQFGGAGAGAWGWVFGAPFAAALGGVSVCAGRCFWGVLPPHPRPLSPVGGEGGICCHLEV